MKNITHGEYEDYPLYDMYISKCALSYVDHTIVDKECEWYVIGAWLRERERETLNLDNLNYYRD